jgi:flagellar basal body-associated protein FliL
MFDVLVLMCAVVFGEEEGSCVWIVVVVAVVVVVVEYAGVFVWMV